MSKRRVVITGMGAVTPYGCGVDKLWENVKAGKSGISHIEGMDLSRHVVTVAGEAKDKDFPILDYMEAKEVKRTDKYVQFAIVAADEAFHDAKLDEVLKTEDPYRIGVIVSSAAGGFRTFEKSHEDILNRGPSKCSPFTIPMIICDMAAGRISMRFGLKGPNKAVLSACATGSHSIGDSVRTIQYGDADIMLAGGCESAICD